MPDMNGIEVTRQIRRLGDDTPIIILTAYDWSDIEEEARNAGVTAFCSKPMFMSDLRDTLLKAIGSEECQNESALPVADEESKEAQVIVPDYQLSLAIGKEGQNARLAARLTGYKIDIKSETQARELGLFEEMGIDYQEEGVYDNLDADFEVSATDDYSDNNTEF